jgi:signal peptidase I
MPLPNATIPPAAAADTKADEAKKKGEHHHRDTTREVFETVVFVVVLVLLLKLFVAEAFVIPTGSMASTLWGDQVRCTCYECGHKFPINASDGGKRIVVDHYICENCGYDSARDDRDAKQDLSSPSSGDRVLVSKYEYHLHEPRRFDVPVFKFPVEPFSVTKQPDGSLDMQGMNYIKRLVALGGETLAVFAGDLYVTRDLHFENRPRPANDLDLWQFRYMYPQDPEALKYFHEGKFEIVRKDPNHILAMRRIVFDLDKQPKSRTGIHRVRWHQVPEDGAGWAMESAGFKHSGDTPGWMRYQHIDPWKESEIRRCYIVDFIGYNVGRDVQLRPFVDIGPGQAMSDHWVSDLLLECTVEIGSPDTETTLELAKGRDRFQAVFSKGECKLYRITSHDDGSDERKEMGSHGTKITKAGKYDVRLANFDSRLTVWVDGKPLAFGRDQTDYPPPDPTRRFEPFDKNDLDQPARIGAKGDVKVSKVSLWRDLQYNCGFHRVDPERRKKLDPLPEEVPSCDSPVQTYYVQPGHFLMFGDNANSSADSRSWGLVPKRLMLGKAVMVYWPFRRMGVIE